MGKNAGNNKCGLGPHAGWVQAHPGGPWQAVVTGDGLRNTWHALAAAYPDNEGQALIVLPEGQRPEDTCAGRNCTREGDDWRKVLERMEVAR